jgi:pimeloyl-ACP methyl ester carboxylesterase
VSVPPFLEPPEGVAATTVDTARGRFAALAAGPDDRPVALLVPGFTGSKEDFIALVGPLGNAGYSVRAVDLAGQLDSPPSTDGSYSLAGFAADILAVADGVAGRPVHLVGHSFGGLVAREAVLADPLAFASLTFVASGPERLPPGQAERLGLFAQVLAEHGLDVVWAAKQALEEQEGVPVPADPAVADFLTRRFLASDPGSLLAMVDTLRTEPDRVDELAAVAPSTLVIVGDQDDVWPPETQRTMALRLGAGVVALPGVGHSPATEAPEATAAALTEFWARAGAAE